MTLTIAELRLNAETKLVPPVTVGHIPSRFVFFSLQVGGAMSGIVVDTKHKVSPIPESGIEIACFAKFYSPLQRNIRQDEMIYRKVVVKI